jgi:hypothetical protein
MMQVYTVTIGRQIRIMRAINIDALFRTLLAMFGDDAYISKIERTE